MKTIIGMAAVAALGLVVMTTTAHYARAQAAAAQAPAGKKAKAVKDTGEYDIYNEVIKDSTQPNAAKKFLTDLDTWTQKYAETDFKDVRMMYYVQAYAANNEAGKAIDAAKPLVDKGIDGLKEGLDNDGSILVPRRRWPPPAIRPRMSLPPARKRRSCWRTSGKPTSRRRKSRRRCRRTNGRPV
jgi:hypothetical protein